MQKKTERLYPSAIGIHNLRKLYVSSASIFGDAKQHLCPLLQYSKVKGLSKCLIHIGVRVKMIYIKKIL